jgi:hypothetical protein
MDVQLNFINRSQGMDNPEIVIFQKNVATGYQANAVAWLVIRNCGTGENHPFVYTDSMQVSTSDAWGNYTPRLDAQPGDAFRAEMNASGDTLVRSGNAPYRGEVQVENGLQQGSISAHVYKSGRVVAIQSSIAPGQMAAFAFQPTIWIGAVSQVVQGHVMNSVIVDQVDTELSLLGIASADIVMTGGGPGINSQPFAFTLQNVVQG